MIRRPPRSTQSRSSAASDVYKRQRQESPWWVPEQLDDAVFDRAFGALVSFLIEVSNDRSHPLRLTVEEQLRQLADRLAGDPDLNALIADRVGELLESD